MTRTRLLKAVTRAAAVYDRQLKTGLVQKLTIIKKSTIYFDPIKLIFLQHYLLIMVTRIVRFLTLPPLVSKIFALQLTLLK